MLKNKRLYFVFIARLIVCPAIIMLILKLIILNVKLADVYTIALITYFASITPTASTVMQFAQIYGKDAEYATAITSITTIGCVVTMPLLIMFLA